MDLPQPDGVQAVSDLRRHGGRVLLLGQGRDDDAPLPGPIHSPSQAVFPDCQIDQPCPSRLFWKLPSSIPVVKEARAALLVSHGPADRLLVQFLLPPVARQRFNRVSYGRTT